MVALHVSLEVNPVIVVGLNIRARYPYTKNIVDISLIKGDVRVGMV